MRHYVVALISYTEIVKNKSYDRKIFRLIYILNKFNSGISLTTSKLAQEFNVSKRTVQRDIQLLDSAGFPLVDSGRGYKFINGFSLQKINVTSEEKFLLDIFYNLFSKIGEPLDKVAKDFMNKVLLSAQKSKADDNKSLSSRQETVLKNEIRKLSDSLAAKMEDLSYPIQFREKIDQFLDDIEKKIKKIRKKEKIKIGFQRVKNYQHSRPLAFISVPKTYFDDPYLKLDSFTDEKDRVFEVKALLPNKFFKKFRKVLMLKMYFKFWGPHLKPKQLTCFDNFASFLGFSNEKKEFNYEYSYANNKGVMATSATVGWEDEVTMPSEDVKPFLNKTGGLYTIKDYSKKKKQKGK